VLVGAEDADAARRSVVAQRAGGVVGDLPAPDDQMVVRGHLGDLLRHGVGILRVDPLERRTSRPGRYSDRSVLPCGPRVSFAKTPAPPPRTRRTVSEAQEASRRPSSGA